MGKRREITIAVHGIRYEEFAALKWRQFLRIFSVMVAVLAAAAFFAVYRGGREIPLAGSLVLILLVAAVLAVYRSSIRRAWRSSGLGSMELTYSFDRDGWTVRRGAEQVRVLWSKTWRVNRSSRTLLLYPNRRSVNLVPLRCLTAEQTDQILAWVRGEK